MVIYKYDGETITVESSITGSTVGSAINRVLVTKVNNDYLLYTRSTTSSNGTRVYNYASGVFTQKAILTGVNQHMIQPKYDNVLFANDYYNTYKHTYNGTNALTRTSKLPLAIYYDEIDENNIRLFSPSGMYECDHTTNPGTITKYIPFDFVPEYFPEITKTSLPFPKVKCFIIFPEISK
jgi:hypothetical protein